MLDMALNLPIIDLRGKIPEEVIGLLALNGLETECADITDLYRPYNGPELTKVECVWIPWELAENFVFILWDGRIRQGIPDKDLHLFYSTNRPPEWGMANTGYMMK